MSLNFTPLCWVYHDGWKFKETKSMIKYDEKGNAIVVDKSKTFYQKGHCHLFMKGVSLNESGPVTTYSGTQDYNFNVVDEWGPNSDDPAQNQSVKLIGKPIWYFYIEQYWRRMYIQSWDQIDQTCKLPLNQTVTYDKYSMISYYQQEIEKANARDRDNYYYNYNVNDYYTYQSWMGYNDYLTVRRRNQAKRIFAQLYCNNEYNPSMQDYQVYNLINNNKIYREDFELFYKNQSKDYNGFIDNIELVMRDFVSAWNNQLYGNKKKINIKDFKYGEDGYIYVPRDQTEGHIGIKYDASLPCHSLGPFMQGGEFYFFNTVVNRTMPCEYWLDENKKTRQYYLKQKSDDFPYTAGDSIWTFKGDNTHYIWIQDTFAESEHFYDDYKKDYKQYSIGYGYITFNQKHRLRDLYPQAYSSYAYAFQNAKRIKNDQFLENIYAYDYYDSEYGDNPRWYGDNSQVVQNTYDEENYIDTINSQDPSTYYYIDENQEIQSSTVEHSIPAYTENSIHWEIKNYWSGWYEKDQIVKCAKDKKWYKRSWAPYLYDSSTENIFRTPSYSDNYYSDPDTYTRQNTDNSYQNQDYMYYNIILDSRWRINQKKPTWNVNKRQSFPNPPPWLCDPIQTSSNNSSTITNSTVGNYLKLLNNSSEELNELDNCSVYFDTNDNQIKIEYKSSSIINAHMARDNHYYQKEEDNRIHLLHWEYCHYYNLVRIYSYDRNIKKIVKNGSYQDQVYIYTVPYEDTDWQDGSHQHKKYIFGYPKTQDEIYNNNYEYYRSKYWTQYPCEHAIITWESFIDFYQQENGYIISIEQENDCFNSFLSQLPYQYSPIYYEDKYDDNGDFQVCYKPLFNSYYDVDIYDHTEYLSYITFDEFKSVWTPLSNQEIINLNLNGSYPKRNRNPYPLPPVKEIYPIIPDNASSAQDYIEIDLSEDEKFMSSSQSEEFQIFNALSSDKQDEYVVKRNIYLNLQQHINDETCPSTLCTNFFPRIDDQIPTINAQRSQMKPPKPPLPISPLDNTKDLYDIQYNSSSGEIISKKPVKSPLNPFIYIYEKNNTPIDEYNYYFDLNDKENSSEMFTIPHSTLVKGDKSLSNDEHPNIPNIHPRESSFNIEDGARNLYPDDKFISPIIEYQKIVRLNYERLPGYEQEEMYLQEHYMDDKQGLWGDGFDVTVSIPFSINNQIQSPFSDNSKITQPVGVYFHDCIKPENKMRYKIDFYDSFDKIRKYDYPNYIRLITGFQKLYIPSLNENIKTVSQNVNQPFNDKNVKFSFYQEDFNNYQETINMRSKTGLNYSKCLYVDNQFISQQECTPPYTFSKNGMIFKYSWEKLLNDYFIFLCSKYHFQNNPIVKNKDCYGNDVIPNSFENNMPSRPNSGNYGKAKEGLYENEYDPIYRENTTSLFPSIDKVAYLDTDENGNTNNDGSYVYGNDIYDINGKIPGYFDSKGNIIKGGNIVTWNEPIKGDGRWTEQCLGAIVKARCVLILEDALGYRWKQVVEDTALSHSDTMQGMDYDTN